MSLVVSAVMSMMLMVSIVMAVVTPGELLPVTLGRHGFVVNIPLLDFFSKQSLESARLYNKSDLELSLRFDILSLDQRNLLNSLSSFPLVLQFQKSGRLSLSNCLATFKDSVSPSSSVFSRCLSNRTDFFFARIFHLSNSLLARILVLHGLVFAFASLRSPLFTFKLS